jgi:predicted DNA-binding transcriptional regulator YafY
MRLKVVIKAQASQVDYIKTKPWHHSFTILNDDIEDFIFAIKVIPNYELETLILSYGEHVEIIEPYFLRSKIRARVKELQDTYE